MTHRSPELEATPGWVLPARLEHVATAPEAFPRLRILELDIVAVDVALSRIVSSIGCGPVPIERSPDLRVSHVPSRMRDSCRRRDASPRQRCPCIPAGRPPSRYPSIAPT